MQSFCDRYDLDKAQRASARAILRDLQERATAYRSSRSAELQRLQNQAVHAESAEERETARAELRAVLSGIDNLFEELKARLENIPTSEQRAAAG